MVLDNTSHVQNQIAFATSQINPITQIQYSKYNLNIVKILNKIGLIHRFYIANKNKSIYVTLFYYNYIPFFKSFKLISTPTKIYNISYKALKLMSLSIGTSTLILSTSKGLITHQKALKFKIGGRLLFIVS